MFAEGRESRYACSNSSGRLGRARGAGAGPGPMTGSLSKASVVDSPAVELPFSIFSSASVIFLIKIQTFCEEFLASVDRFLVYIQLS